MAQGIVFSDASPLIGLSLVDGLGWLESLFGEVCITHKVVEELLPKGDKPGKSEITAAIAKGTLSVIEDIWTEPVFPMLDEGEANTLRVALHQEKRCLVLIDEIAGRAIASELGVMVTGVVGIIIAARRQGLIASAKPVFENLLKHHFRLIDTLANTALKSLGEV